MLEGRRGIVFLGILFVCGLVCGSTAWGEDKLAEQAKSVKVEANPPVAVKSAVEKHEAILQQPVKVEIKAGTTLRDAIKKMGEAAGLEIEFEGLLPDASKEVYSIVLNKDINVKGHTFQSCLNAMSKKIMYSVDDLNTDSLPAYEYGATPTRSGVLISNTAIRWGVPCKLTSQPYSINDLANNPNAVAEVAGLIRSHVKVRWAKNALAHAKSSESRLALESLELTHNLSSINLFQSKNILIIRTSRSAHYEIKQFLTMLRKVIKEQPQQQPTN